MNAAAHLEGFVAAGVGLLLPQSGGLLVGRCQLVPLEHQRLLKLLLRLRLQQLLPEGDVREQGGERPAQLHRCLGAFLQKSVRKWACIRIMRINDLFALNTTHIIRHVATLAFIKLMNIHSPVTLYLDSLYLQHFNSSSAEKRF